MKNLTRNALACGLVLSLVSFSMAQTPVSVPINNWTYQHHASTATEGYLRGSAAVISARGQQNYLNSVAAVNYQTALRQRIENSGLYVKTYFENKEINRQYREKYDYVPPTKEQWARITAKSLPDPLSETQFDRDSGQLIWPHILRTDEYKALRTRIDDLLVNRTPDNSGDGSPFQIEVHNLIDGMKMLLKNNIDSVSTSQYASAKEFLMSLDYEVQQPLGSGINGDVATDGNEQT